MTEDSFHNRKYMLGGIVLTIVVVYIVRLAYLQLLSSDYKIFADSNAFMNNVIFPARGVMFDRNGSLLVYNQPAYDIMVVMHEVENLDTLDFCATLDITEQDFKQRMANIKDRSKNPGYSSYTQQVFMSQLPRQNFSVFQEKLFRFSGFYIRERSVRRYSYPNAAHLLGDVAEVSPSDVERDPYYYPGDYIGKQGVERSYEKELRGLKGIQVLLRDAQGRTHGHYKGGEFDRKPVPGKNLTLSIDIELQKLGERLMQGKMGAIVAIEPATGEVLAMVSAPSYDPSQMEGRARGQHMIEMLHDPHHPMLNRAIQGTYPPGSTFKPAQGLTFLEEGIITGSTLFPCYHGFRHAHHKIGCHGHPSPINFVPAVATSCNGYFCWGLYYMLGNRQKYGTPQVAMNIWRDYMVSMGFGYRLGIDIANENRGFVPNTAYFDKAKGKYWNSLGVISLSIGQGELLLTPIQLCNVAATIANKGWFYTPHVVHQIEGCEIDSLYRTKRYTDVDSSYFNIIQDGMEAAVWGATGGTAHGAQIPGIKVCGKTGTAQNPHGKDHSIFMSFAPREKPEIAISVYVENAGFGATWAVPIGSLMIEKYLTGEIRPERKWVEERMVNSVLVTK